MDFVINRFCMKLFKTSDMNIVIKTCKQNFSFRGHFWIRERVPSATNVVVVLVVWVLAVIRFSKY